MEQWTLVTGGGRRLGAALCRHLAKNGYPVLLHYRYSENEALQVVEECRAMGVPSAVIHGDFSSLESTNQFIAKCLTQYPSIKNLINNVGNYLVKSAAETTPVEWQALFQTNVHAPFAISKALMPSIAAYKGGIINIGIAGINHIAATTRYTAYMASKTALWMLTKSLAKEWAPNIRVNMVSPGYIENAVDLPTDFANIPMQRPATLQEITRVVQFLLDDASGYITGQNIEVSGGVRL